MKKTVFSILLLAYVKFLHAQNISQLPPSFPVTGERVLIRECGNYTVSFLDEKSDPYKEVKQHLINQIGKAEYAQLVKRCAPSRWPISIRNAFDCENTLETFQLVMYQIATYPSDGYYKSRAIVRIPFEYNKYWQPGVAWDGNVYLDIPEDDLIYWSLEYADQGRIPPLDERITPLPDETNYLYQPAPGDKLVYRVTTPDGLSYDFTVRLKQYVNPLIEEGTAYPIVFQWTMGEPVNTSGMVHLCSACLAESVHYQNYFNDGSNEVFNDKLTVFMSGKNFYEPLQGSSRSTVMVMDGTEITFYDKKDVLDPFIIEANGRTYPLAAKFYNNSDNMTGTKSIWVQAHGARLILKMQLEFTIELKEIR